MIWRGKRSRVKSGALSPSGCILRFILGANPVRQTSNPCEHAAAIDKPGLFTVFDLFCSVLMKKRFDKYPIYSATAADGGKSEPQLFSCCAILLHSSVNPSQLRPAAAGVFISAWRKAPPQPLHLLQRHVALLSCLSASSQQPLTLALPSVAGEVLPRLLMRCDTLMGSLLFICSPPLMLSQANQPLAAPRSPLGKNRGILGLAGPGIAKTTTVALIAKNVLSFVRESPNFGATADE